jgi:hypothetical protein
MDRPHSPKCETRQAYGQEDSGPERVRNFSADLHIFDAEIMDAPILRLHGSVEIKGIQTPRPVRIEIEIEPLTWNREAAKVTLLNFAYFPFS